MVRAGYWLQGNSALESIKSEHFTHLFCAFAKHDTSNNHIVLPHHDFSRFTDVVRQRNPEVKTLLSIGGGGPDRQQIATGFANMARNSDTRKIFIQSCIDVARDNNFDGIDLDYEYPTNHDQMRDLGILLTELKGKVTEKGVPLILTAAVRFRNTNYEETQDPYPGPEINQSLDWINVMAYDLWTPEAWAEPHTGPSAPLRDPTGNGASASDGINTWINRAGLPANKIVLGIPFYGYAWRLVNPNNHGFGAPTAGPAFPNNGELTYRVIKASFPNAITVYDSQIGASYCYSGSTWISYDDADAVREKVLYVQQTGLLGYFAWEVSGDDAAYTLSTTAHSVPLN